MSESRWRLRYRPIIANVLKVTAGEPWSVVAAALREAFPSGSHENWPYKMWLKEIRFQRGIARDKRLKKGEKRQVASCGGQRELFPAEGQS